MSVATVRCCCEYYMPTWHTDDVYRLLHFVISIQLSLAFSFTFLRRTRNWLNRYFMSWWKSCHVFPRIESHKRKWKCHFHGIKWFVWAHLARVNILLVGKKNNQSFLISFALARMQQRIISSQNVYIVFSLSNNRANNLIQVLNTFLR